MDDAPYRPEDEHERLQRLAGMLFQAARTGDVGLLAEAMAGGAPPDLSNQSGDSLVMLAAYHGHGTALTVLLDAGAEVDLMNDRGQTPLAGAVFKGYDEVARLLLAGGADPRLGSPPPITAAMLFQREDLLPLMEEAIARLDGT